MTDQRVTEVTVLQVESVPLLITGDLTVGNPSVLVTAEGSASRYMAVGAAEVFQVTFRVPEVEGPRVGDRYAITVSNANPVGTTFAVTWADDAIDGALADLIAYRDHPHRSDRQPTEQSVMVAIDCLRAVVKMNEDGL